MKTIEFQSIIENGIIKVPKQFDLKSKEVKIAIFEKDVYDSEILHIEIDKQLKKYMPVSIIQNYLEQQLQFLLMDQIKNNIDKTITESGLDNELLLENVKEQAWNDYKDYFLKGVKIN